MRVQNIDPETFTAHRAIHNIQEDSRVKNMDPEEKSTRQLQHDAQERTRLRKLIIQQQQQTRSHCTQQEACSVAATNEARRSRYNYQSLMIHINQHNC